AGDSVALVGRRWALMLARFFTIVRGMPVAVRLWHGAGAGDVRDETRDGRWLGLPSARVRPRTVGSSLGGLARVRAGRWQPGHPQRTRDHAAEPRGPRIRGDGTDSRLPGGRGGPHAHGAGAASRGGPIGAAGL